MPKCLRPECKKKAYGRGLCMSDYLAARRLVIAGKTTWAELEKNKKASPIYRGIAKDWFLSKKK